MRTSSARIQPYIQQLDKVLQALQGREIILCLDANARSTMWHSQETNAKGEKLESFILQHRLTIVNSPQRISTFNPLTAMGAYMRPAKAISVAYGRIYAPGEGFDRYFLSHVYVRQLFLLYMSNTRRKANTPTYFVA